MNNPDYINMLYSPLDLNFNQGDWSVILRISKLAVLKIRLKKSSTTMLVQDHGEVLFSIQICSRHLINIAKFIVETLESKGPIERLKPGNKRSIIQPGQRYDKLLIISKVTRMSGEKAYKQKWLCKCDCGNYINIANSKLLHPNYKTCGCYEARKLHDEK